VTGDDDRIGYLAGDASAQLGAHERADLDELRALLDDPATWAEPSDDLEDRIVTAIAAEPTAPPGSRKMPPERVRRRRKLSVIAATSAAAVALLVGIALSVTNNTTSALRFHVALTATNLAPGASGSATLTRTDAGWQVKLRISGLSRLDNGRYYQAWLKDPSGKLVAVGTFNQGPAVTLWSGVSPQDFPTLTITEQTANGNPASSGLRVLVGPIKK
jgi:Anti-sigma-K factor rskA, C-terminal